MEETPENGKEPSHSAHANGMNERMNEWMNEWKNEWMNEWMNEWNYLHITLTMQDLPMQ